MSQDRTSDVNVGAQNYRAFLLRCWQEPGAGPGESPIWRFTLVQMGKEGVRMSGGFSDLPAGRTAGDARTHTLRDTRARRLIHAQTRTAAQAPGKPLLDGKLVSNELMHADFSCEER